MCFFCNKNPSSQLLLLLFLVIVGTLLSVLFTFAISELLGLPLSKLNESLVFVRLVQVLSVSLLFLMPSFVYAWLQGEGIGKTLQMRHLPTMRGGALGLVGLFLLMPLVSLTSYWNEMLTLPSLLAPIEEWMRMQETLAEEMVAQFFVEKGWWSFVQNVFVIAIMAGLSEEVFFRGVVQRIIERSSSNPHLAIWGAAILFSAIHMQFFSFLPRMFLGAYLGYLLLWTRTLWVPIIVHAANNMILVIIMSSDSLKANEFLNGDIQAKDTPYYLLASIVSLLFLSFLVRKYQSRP